MKKVALLLITLLFLATIVLAVSYSSEEKELIKECKINCRENKKAEIKLCKEQFVSKERTACAKQAREKYRNCHKNCKYTALNNNITCESGKYNAGDRFLDSCDVCFCDFDSKIKCEKSPNCNFNDFNITKYQCTSNNGFYQSLCQGPFGRIRCSNTPYCQCDGNFNYQCPQDYICIHEFTISNMPVGLPPWISQIEEDLGDIGICARMPELHTCGNLICENLLCDNCTIAETIYNCNYDCK